MSATEQPDPGGGCTLIGELSVVSVARREPELPLAKDEMQARRYIVEMSIARPIPCVVLALFAATLSCAGKTEGSASNSGGAPSNSGGAPSNSGGASNVGGSGETCGPVACPAGQYCCNASCGLCAPKNAACLQIACEPGATEGGAGGSAACSTAADCRLFSDYCTGCDCRALAKLAPDPVCSGPGVMCLLDPCVSHTVACKVRHCVVQ